MEPMTALITTISGRLVAAVSSEVAGVWLRLSDAQRLAFRGIATDAATLALARVRGTWDEARIRRESAHVYAQAMNLTAIGGTALADSLEAAVGDVVKAGIPKTES